jgi:hypothetical protein
VARAVFLLVVVWWAWIYTTWMVNWFDPESPVVRAVLTGVMLASLLMAAALPESLGEHGVLFAAAPSRPLSCLSTVAGSWGGSHSLAPTPLFTFFPDT